MLDAPHFFLFLTPMLIPLMFCMSVLLSRLTLSVWLGPVFVMEEVGGIYTHS